ncbi:MAG TPA: dihydrofolate reductase [Candidatus Colwellbacteria bacterium]|jgi:dihydrofolate reductase|nr:dihydrofolate reductase [Candidatus Colwellbacteria bacterium]
MNGHKIHITCINGSSIDGRITDVHRHFHQWSSQEDQKFLKSEIKKADCIIVGYITYKRSVNLLKNKRTIVFNRRNIKYLGNNIYFIKPNRKTLFKILHSTQSRKALVIGGMNTYSWFIKQNIVDKWYITIEPYFFGTGLPLLKIKEFKPKNARLESVKRINNKGTLLLKYSINK